MFFLRNNILNTEIKYIQIKNSVKFELSSQLSFHFDISLSKEERLFFKKTTSKGGVLAINDNNLILILEQIQELSNLGENELAESLKTFINKELLPGHLSVDTDFDIALWN